MTNMYIYNSNNQKHVLLCWELWRVRGLGLLILERRVLLVTASWQEGFIIKTLILHTTFLNPGKGPGKDIACLFWSL